MKKLFSIVLSIVLSVSCIGCGMKQPEDYLKVYLDAMQDLRVEDLAKYGLDVSSVLPPNKAVSETQINDLFKQMLTGFTYEIGESTIDGDTATVKVSITNKDMTNIDVGFIEKFKDYLNEVNIYTTEKEIEEKVVEFLFGAMIEAQNSNNFKTFDVSIKMRKVGSIWEVKEEDVEEEFADAITGGFLTGMEKTEKEMKKLA